MASKKSTRTRVRRPTKTVEYRWFPAVAPGGLYGGICADTEREAEEFNEKDKGSKLVRVRMEYTLPAKLPTAPKVATQNVERMGEDVPEPELSKELHKLLVRFDDQFCVLHCAFKALDENEFVDCDESAARARNVIHGVLEALDVLRRAYEGVSLRIAHEGIPVRFKGARPS